MSVKSITVTCGFKGAYSFDLIPVTSLQLDEPNSSAIEAVKNPAALDIAIPITGTFTGFTEDVPCDLFWIVEKEGKDNEVSDPIKAQIRLGSEGKCSVVVDGRAPVINIIENDLMGSGNIRYRVSPDFPYAKSVELTSKSLSFINDISVKIKKPSSSLFIGSDISFVPVYQSIFKEAEVRLEIFQTEQFCEDDKGFGTAESFVSHSWTGGKKEAYDWAVGYESADKDMLMHLQKPEEEQLRFGYLLKVIKGANEIVTRCEPEAFTGIRKAKIEKFSVFKDHGKKRVILQGKIANFAPGSAPQFQFALGISDRIEHFDGMYGSDSLVLHSRMVAEENEKNPVRMYTDNVKSRSFADVKEDGVFLVAMAIKNLSDKNRVFGMLRSAELHEKKHSFTAASYVIDYDEDIFTGFVDDTLVYKGYEKWICSKEAKDFIEGELASPIQLNDDGYDINWVFIQKLEGCKREVYVPNKKGRVKGSSGPTIAAGFDIGQHSLSDLKRYEFGDVIENKLKKYVNMKGEKAYQFVKDNPMILSEDEVALINKRVKAVKIAAAVAFFESDSSAKGMFKRLPRAAQTVFMSVFFQHERGIPTFKKLMVSQKYKDAVIELMKFTTLTETVQNKSTKKSSEIMQFLPRRCKEARYLLQVITDAEEQKTAKDRILEREAECLKAYGTSPLLPPNYYV